MSVVINGSAGVTTNSGAVYNGISAGTAVASTSGTSIDFTSIPSWVKRITVMFSGVSTNSTSPMQVQLGAGSVQTTGYTAQSALIFSSGTGFATNDISTGFPTSSSLAAQTMSGTYVFTLLGSNIWTGTGTVRLDSARGVYMMGSVTLSGTLDRVRITTVNGTDTFDAGSINILYE